MSCGRGTGSHRSSPVGEGLGQGKGMFVGVGECGASSRLLDLGEKFPHRSQSEGWPSAG